MRCGVLLAGGVVGLYCLAGGVGCVSLDEYNRIKAANRNLTAEKETVAQELFDERHVNDSLRTRAESLDRELQTKNELLANLRGENDLLDEMRKNAVGQLEGLANRKFTDINIPKLPAPLDSALKAFASQHSAEVAYDASRGTVKWTGDLLFPLGSDVVNDSSMNSLRGFVEILKSSAAADFEVVIIGHTDTKPIQRPGTKEKHPTNWHLSSHRAIAVGSVLQKYSYQPNRIAVVGCGEYRPIGDNSTESGAAQNRRVDIYIVPVGTIAAGSAETNRPTASEKPSPMKPTLKPPPEKPEKP